MPQAYNQIMKKISFTILLTFTAATAFAQNASQVQKLFEAGQYQRVVESAQPDGDPGVLYTAAQSTPGSPSGCADSTTR